MKSESEVDKNEKDCIDLGVLLAFLCGIVSADLGSDRRKYYPTAASVRFLEIRIATPQQQGNCNILWDTTRREGLRAGIEYYGELISDLQSKGYTVNIIRCRG